MEGSDFRLCGVTTPQFNIRINIICNCLKLILTLLILLRIPLMPIANFEVKVCTVCNEMYVKNLQEVDKYLKKNSLHGII